MNTYQVELTKSYLITIQAESEEKAREFSELYTGDIIDLSSENDRMKNNFSIDDIECTINESFGCELIEND